MQNNPIPNYDVIVIGAGSIGTPTAFYLAQAGLKVLVLDGGGSIGQGSNKKAIGGIRATHSDPAKIRLCLRGLEVFSTWRKQYGDDIEWTQGGYCYVAYTPREEKILKDLLAVQKPLGLHVDWLDGKQLLQAVPALNPHGLLGGTLSSEDGSISPLLAIHAFYTHALEAGAEFRFNEPVIELVVQSGCIKGVRTTLANYSSNFVINAAGAWAAQIGLLAGMQIAVKPDAHEAAITEAVAHFLNPMIVDIRPIPGSSNFYFYQHATGQIVFCITPSPQIWGYDTRETSNFLPMVARRMVDLMPCLKNIRVRRTWRGLYPMTPDGFPIIGWSHEAKGFLQAAGMCGQGLMLGPGVAELLTRMIQSKTAEGDEEIIQILSPYRQFAGQEMLE